MILILSDGIKLRINIQDKNLFEKAMRQILPDLSFPEYSDLDVPGNTIFVKGGNAGIIICHFATNEYKVYDRTCSYEPSLACSYIDSINFFVAYCGCCTSAFLLDQNLLSDDQDG